MTSSAATSIWRSRVAGALISSLGTTAYYAAPDLIHSRCGHRALRVGVLTALTVDAVVRWKLTASPSERRAWREAIEQIRRQPASGQAVVVAVSLGALGAGVGVNVAFERWLTRRADRRALAGRRWPRLPDALALSALAAVGALMPPEAVEQALGGESVFDDATLERLRRAVDDVGEQAGPVAAPEAGAAGDSCECCAVQEDHGVRIDWSDPEGGASGDRR